MADREYSQTAVVLAEGEKLPLRKDPVYKQFLKEIGGRAGLRAIAMASSNIKATELLALLDDESYKSWGAKKLLQQASISYNEVLSMRDERSRNLAVSNMIAKLPELAEDLMEDAKTLRAVCPICNGLRVREYTTKDNIRNVVICEGCKGFGEIRKVGDKDARQIVAKATKIIDNGPGMVIDARTQVNTVINNPAGGFEDLIKKAGKVIQLTPKRIEDEDSSVSSRYVGDEYSA